MASSREKVATKVAWPDVRCPWNRHGRQWNNEANAWMSPRDALHTPTIDTTAVVFRSLSRILRSSSSVVYRGSKLNNIRNTRRHSIVSLSIERERKWREKLQRSRMFPSSFDIPLKRRNNGTSWPPSVPPSTVLKDGRQTEMAAARGKGRSNLTGLSQ